jgi:hypothetical protein
MIAFSKPKATSKKVPSTYPLDAQGVAVNDADPQNPPQGTTVRGPHHVPLCLHQRPRFITVNEVRNDKRVKNLHLGLHREVAIPPHMGELHKSAQPTRTTSINLLLQARLGVDDASQILERLH